MKAIIKIVLALVILLACVNATRAAFNDYQFQDAVHEALLFNPRADEAEIVKAIMKLAYEYEIPLDAGDIQIRMIGQDLRVNMSYTENVVLIPGVFAKDWTFTPSASTRVLGGAR